MAQHGSNRGGGGGESISESIKVYCRVRPDMPEESVESTAEDNIYLTGGSCEQETGGNRISHINEEANQCTYTTSAAKTEQKFKMDGFFGPGTTQEKVRQCQHMM